MILSKKTILKKIKEGELRIIPFAATQVQPTSIDLRLGNHFMLIDESSTPFISLEN